MQREYSKNSFVYTIDSLFCVPDEYIVVDNDDPVALSLEEWTQLKSHHDSWKSQDWTKNNNVDVTNIVAVSNHMSGENKRVLWFVRFLIDGADRKPGLTFGESFLWQITPRQCKHYFGEMCLFADEGEDSHEMNELMCYPPTPCLFTPKDFPKCAPLDDLGVLSYSERVFVMSVRPAPTAKSGEAGSCIVTAPGYAMGGGVPLRIRESTTKTFPLAMLNDATGLTDYMSTRPTMCMDVSELIMQFAVTSAVHASSVSFLCTLRSVNRQFRDMVNDTAVGVLNDAYACCNPLLYKSTVAVDELFGARDVVLDNKFVFVRLLAEWHTRNLYSFVRVRTEKDLHGTPGSNGHPGTQAHTRGGVPVTM